MMHTNLNEFDIMFSKRENFKIVFVINPFIYGQYLYSHDIH